MDFLKHKLQSTEKETHQQYFQQQQQQQKVKNEINEFISNLRNHFTEEEQIVFPFELKVYSV